ncbi:hypothetical protein AB9P05_16650 [Roseivirga sp. BDSF3-8]|uniref:hypothetical protein n=1 Tax=Roseivirga sp. BDSF3-8 TaxID=3241598 RepID=UPI003532282E
MTLAVRIFSVLSLFLIAFTSCKTERELMQDKVELLVSVNEHSEPEMLFLNYLGAPKEDLDADEGLLVVPSNLMIVDAQGGVPKGAEFVLSLSRKQADTDNGPILKIFDPTTGRYTETSYVIIGIKPKEALEENN